MLKGLGKKLTKWASKHRSTLCGVDAWGLGVLAGGGVNLLMGGPEDPVAWFATAGVGTAVEKGIYYGCEH